VYTAQVTGRKIFMIKNKQVFIIGEYWSMLVWACTPQVPYPI
jgi:hypothetical protein